MVNILNSIDIQLKFILQFCSIRKAYCIAHQAMQALRYDSQIQDHTARLPDNPDWLPILTSMKARKPWAKVLMENEKKANRMQEKAITLENKHRAIKR